MYFGWATFSQQKADLSIPEESVIFVLCIETFNYMCFKSFSCWCRDFLFVYSKVFCPYVFIFQGEYSLLILFLYFYHLNFHLKYLFIFFKIFNSNWNYCKASVLKFTFILKTENWLFHCFWIKHLFLWFKLLSMSFKLNIF